MASSSRLQTTRRRLGRIGRHRTALARRSARMAAIRGVTALTLAAVVIALGFALGSSAAWIAAAAGVLLFQIPVRIHDRIERARERWRSWGELQNHQRARLEHDWEDLPRDFDDVIDPLHPFAHDLDLVGDRSILHLIDTTTSSGGHGRLRAWLLGEAPDLAAIAKRQRRVAALAELRHFRDRLGLFVREGLGARRRIWDTERLVDWVGRRHDIGRLRWLLWLLAPLGVANLILIAGALRAGWPPWWGFTVPLYFLGYVASMRILAPLLDEAMRLEELVTPLRAVLAWLEDRVVPAALEEVVAPLRRTDRHRPAAVVARTSRIVWAACLRTNQILWLLVNVVAPWDLFVALRLERVRGELREHLPRWLDALHELEALGALANFADLDPGTCFPTFVDEAGPFLEAERIGHPLLRPDQRVCNEFGVEPMGSVVLVSGSNMSGKSTFLRTVGVNVALANAGSVVVASRLRLRAMRPFTCIRVSDSVNDGISYFYAEVRRLAALLRSLESEDALPQLSLIDEIYRGTNNRERLAGGSAFVERVIGTRGCVLLSTHDIELARLADAREEVTNLHFREEVGERVIEFDFRLREGPCPTTNALKLMEREGLPVPEGGE